jgi:hypothetical protein
MSNAQAGFLQDCKRKPASIFQDAKQEVFSSDILVI